LQLHVLHAATEAEIEAAFAGFAQLRAGVLVIGADAFFNAKSRLPANVSLMQRIKSGLFGSRASRSSRHFNGTEETWSDGISGLVSGNEVGARKS
jgi:hypothetical protein